MSNFPQQVSDTVKPGTSALLLVADKVTPAKALEALSKFGGTVLESSPSHDAESQLQQAEAGPGGQAPESATAGASC